MEKKISPNLIMAAVGAAIGIIAALLVHAGNPGNMGFCIACFLRDISGALGFHRAGAVQYLRPEIPGLIIGAMLGAFATGEFRARGGSSPWMRFLLGSFLMVGALVFLGCPIRLFLRLGGGDLNALVGLAGLVVGVLLGVYLLQRGFSLGRSLKQKKVAGLFFPLIGILLAVAALAPFVLDAKAGGPLFKSTVAPGSQAAPVLISLVAGVIVGLIVQRTRFCTVGGIRDLFMTKDYYLISGITALVGGNLITNLFLGRFNVGWVNQPVAHTNALWNFMGMVLVGLTAIQLGGCPLRQLVMASEGDGDAAVTVMGMLAGAALAHNFGLASSAKGPSLYGPYVVVAMLGLALWMGWGMREVD